MEKMTQYAEIPEIKKGIAFSDPCYDGEVWCQYRKEFQASDWLMKLDTSRDEDGYVNFNLSIGRHTLLSGLSVKETERGAAVSSFSHYESSDTELGMDTARIFVGSLDNFENFAEEASIYTASDGLFGDLLVFTAKGEKEPAGFLVIGCVDGSITDEKDLFQTAVASFDGKQIEQARYEQLTDKEDIGLRIEIAKEMMEAKKAVNRDKPDKNQPER